MNASNDLATTQAGSQIQQLPADIEAAAGFASLEKSRQNLVFQTIQEAISAVPPRLEATFPRVVAAYTTLTNLVEAAANGQLSDDDLGRIEMDVEAAGGVIAPGLWSQGDNSIAAFRAATFGMLRRNFQPPVVEAAISALNARLQTLKLNDLGRVFQVIANFFSPLTPTTTNAARLQVFAGLDTERQVLVFRTIQDGILATPPRTEASFSAVVLAFQAEMALLKCAAEGQLSDEPLARLEAGIEAAGGLLSPGIYAQGKQSIASFRAETFKALQPMLPPEVLTAATSALNARLRDLRPDSLPVLFKAVQTFFMPLLSQGWNSPTLQSFKTLDPYRQSLVFRTVEQAISGRPDLQPTIFSSAVKAICAEQGVIKEAAAGRLSMDTLQTLQTAIDECGGTVAPGLRATGEGSLGEFLDSTFLTLNRSMPAEVHKAALSALNVKLRTSPINSLDDVKSVTWAFLQPLITAIGHAPAIRPSTPQETLPPAEPVIIEEVTLVPPLVFELPQDAAEESTNPDTWAAQATDPPPIQPDPLQPVSTAPAEVVTTLEEVIPTPILQDPNPLELADEEKKNQFQQDG